VIDVPKPGKIKPLAKTRFKVEFTADEQLYADIQRAKDLLGPGLPRGELNELFGLALRRLVEDLEKKKFAKTSRSRSAPVNNAKPAVKKSRTIPNHVKRAVVERDEACCSYVDADGNQCRERWGLEFHHQEIPFARGGPPTVENLTLHCRSHNQLAAEGDYGAEFMSGKARAGRTRDRRPEPSG
jgi:hypothetical protein